MWCRRNICIFLKKRSMCTKVTPSTAPSETTTTSAYNISRTDSPKLLTNSIFSTVSMDDIKTTLQKSDCKFEDGYTCFVTQCVNCEEGRQGTVYVNKTTGFVLCMDCQETGDWNSFKSRLVKPTLKGHKTVVKTTSTKVIRLKDVVEPISRRWHELKKQYQMYSSLSDEVKENIIVSLGFQITAEKNVLDQLDPVYNAGEGILYFPLSNGSTGKRILGIRQVDIQGNESCFPFKKCPGILRYIPARITKKYDQVILVHNIRDLIFLSLQKHNYHVICLPHGTSALPQEVLPSLEQYTRIVFWFGSDRLNLRAAWSFAKKLNEERCYIVKEVEVPSDKKIKNFDIKNILQSAQHMILEHVITFANLKNDVYLGLTNSNFSEGIKWKRFPALNNILLGHRRGEVTIITGPTGCGKTTFLSEYSLDLATQGVSTLWGSFEIHNQRLARIMLQQFVLEPLQENLHKFDAWCEEFMKLPIYFLKFHGQQPIDDVMRVVEHATYVHDVQHLIIDNLQFMLGMSAQEDKNMDRFYKQDKVIAAFRTFATVRDCHVTLIIHPKKEKDGEELMISSIFGGVKASQEADNIIILQKKMLESLHIKKYLQVVKNRYSGDLGIVPLQFDKPALSFGAKHLKNLERKVSK